MTEINGEKTSHDASNKQLHAFESVVTQLRALGYRDGLLQRQYGFQDWFQPERPERVVPAAAFGQTPVSYGTACFAVLLSNERSGSQLVEECRSLGAPIALEIRESQVALWKVSRKPQPGDLVRVFPHAAIRTVFREQDHDWSPRELMRAKSIASPGPRQLDFFDLGLIPALEHHIRTKLDPLLRDVFFNANEENRRQTGRFLTQADLFRLVFWFLAGKVLSDRRVIQVKSGADPATILDQVSRHYSERVPRGIHSATLDIIHRRLWATVDFRNLSVEVLALIYENTLVDEETREKHGVHSTPPNIARYIVNHLPLETLSRNNRRILEPCSGQGTFLIAGLNRLRDLLPASMHPKKRHHYFKRMLRGFEIDRFAIEVSRLSLMLADFPNPNGWKLNQTDVFASSGFRKAVSRSSVVLCNPPYEDFDDAERRRYKPRSVHKPVELLGIVLDNLPRTGLIGFVLPRQFIDGRGYKSIRGRVFDRFEDVEVVSLPGGGVFKKSGAETALLLGRHPRSQSSKLYTTHSKVGEKDKRKFVDELKVTRRDVGSLTRNQAERSLAIPDLRSVWGRLSPDLTLGKCARIHRGIEWNVPFEENKDRLISHSPKAGYAAGILSTEDGLNAYVRPRLTYLNTSREFQRGRAHDLPWSRPKTVVNAVRKSRGPWRLAAFSDREGLVCYQNFIGIWPKSNLSPIHIAAILNGPVANAFAATHEGGKHVTIETLKRIPIPEFSEAQLSRVRDLVTRIEHRLSQAELFQETQTPPSTLLLEIDSIVLEGYGFPPRVERELLEYFRGADRPTTFPVGEYFPEDFEPCIPLSMFISSEFSRAAASEFLRENVVDPAVLAALRAASESFGE